MKKVQFFSDFWCQDAVLNLHAEHVFNTCKIGRLPLSHRPPEVGSSPSVHSLSPTLYYIPPSQYSPTYCGGGAGGVQAGGKASPNKQLHLRTGSETSNPRLRIFASNFTEKQDQSRL